MVADTGQADTGAAAVSVRPLVPADLEWAVDVLGGELAGRLQARRGELIDVLADDGLVAERGGRPAGLLTYRPDGTGRIEISALLAVDRGVGVGSALVRALLPIARDAGAREIRVTTTNDNLTALGFYQRRGFRLAELRAGAVDASRRTLKPSISEIGEAGLPLRDELELSLEI